MPRIFYLILFLVITLLPFPLIWLGQASLLTARAQNPASGLNNTGVRQNYPAGGFYPFWGGIFYYDSGRGYYGGRGRSWMQRSYDSYRSGGSGFKSFDDGGSSIFGK